MWHEAVLPRNQNEGEVMCALREKMTSTIWSHEVVAKRTMFAHGPELSTVPLEAQSLKTLSKMKQPRRILEIGMYTGYGASTMLKGCENATLASLEIDSFLKPWVRDGLASMPNLLSRREIEVGSALDTLEKMPSSEAPSSEALDLVSVDANKNGYMRYVGVLIARSIPAKNAMTVDESTLKDCENETLVSLELDPFLKPWVQECLTSMPNTLSRHEIEVGPAFDTLEKMPSSEAFDLVSVDANKREYKRHVEMRIARRPARQKRDDSSRQHVVLWISVNAVRVLFFEVMTAAVILEEVERRTLVPRDMIRLVHKGKTISGKKSMKENYFEAKETIEMSLRLLGGMEASEQMDTHETEEDREKKGSCTKEKKEKRTKPNEDMAHLKRDIMEALKKSDEKWNATPERLMKKLKTTQKRLRKERMTSRERLTICWRDS